MKLEDYLKDSELLGKGTEYAYHKFLNDLAKNQESLEGERKANTFILNDTIKRVVELEKKIDILRCQCYSEDCLQCSKLKQLFNN